MFKLHPTRKFARNFFAKLLHIKREKKRRSAKFYFLNTQQLRWDPSGGDVTPLNHILFKLCMINGGKMKLGDTLVTLCCISWIAQHDCRISPSIRSFHLIQFRMWEKSIFIFIISRQFLLLWNNQTLFPFGFHIIHILFLSSRSVCAGMSY